MKPFGLLLASTLVLALAVPAEAARRKTRFDAIRYCERTGGRQFLRHDPAFRRFVIDRSHVSIEKFADRVGTMFISTVYHGKATYEAAAGPKAVRFICLHAGMGRRAVFVYLLPD
jgi:hypothetical protein